MTADILPRATPTVIYQQLADGAVLFLPEEEVYFGLNEVGCLIWSLLPPASGRFSQLCDALVAHFPDVERSTIESDVKELIDDLMAHHLVRLDTPRDGEMAGGAANGS